MKIYTLTGDDGTTSLSGGRRVSKFSPRVEAYGSVDELIAWIGLIRSSSAASSRKDILIYIQDQLMRAAAALAHDPENPLSRKTEPSPDCLSVLEREIDEMESQLSPLRNFILPGGSDVVSHCHIARCVCRRAERAVLRLKQDEESPDIVHKFLNRLSDYLFVLSRRIALDLDTEELKWTI